MYRQNYAPTDLGSHNSVIFVDSRMLRSLYPQSHTPTDLGIYKT